MLLSVLSEFFNVEVIVGVKGVLKIKIKIFSNFEKPIRIPSSPSIKSVLKCIKVNHFFKTLNFQDFKVHESAWKCNKIRLKCCSLLNISSVSKIQRSWIWEEC